MTYIDSSGDKCWSGIKIYGRNGGSKYDFEDLWASMTKDQAYGSSSKGEGHHGTEFCSFACFDESIREWLRRCKQFMI
jgi:hypothetical protein